MTLSEAVAQGHAWLRRKEWNTGARLRIDIMVHDDGTRFRGPWGHLYDRETQRLIGAPTPQDFVMLDSGSDDEWEPCDPPES